MVAWLETNIFFYSGLKQSNFKIVEHIVNNNCDTYNIFGIQTHKLLIGSWHTKCNTELPKLLLKIMNKSIIIKWYIYRYTSPRFSALIPLLISSVCGLGSERFSSWKGQILATPLGIAVWSYLTVYKHIQCKSISHMSIKLPFSYHITRIFFKNKLHYCHWPVRKRK